MEIKKTTALTKIANLKKRIWAIQGGQGAGKTFSILQILINHASSHEDKRIYVASAQLSKMRDTVIDDFLKIMRGYNLFDRDEWVGGVLYRFPNGSQIKFMGLDKEDIGKGLRSDVMFVNEANKINFNTYQELTSRANRIIVDYNPNNKFWVHDELLPDPECEFLNLTFLDNEHLGHAERNTVLGYKEKGYDLYGNEINQYWANMWRVYGLGEIGRLAGAIFENWEKGKFNDELPIAYGLDFGTKDPDALVKVAIDHSNFIIYVKEEIYQNALSTKDLGLLIKNKVPKGKLIVADSAGARTIQDLKSSGVNIKPVSKNKIIDDIKLIQGYRMIIDESSENLIEELSNYIWLDRKGEVPIDKFNHAIDALRYIVQTLVSPRKPKSSRLVRGSRR